jgi:hypothetical protein
MLLIKDIHNHFHNAANVVTIYCHYEPIYANEGNLPYRLIIRMIDGHEACIGNIQYDHEVQKFIQSRIVKI